VTEYTIEKRVGELLVTAYGIEFTRHPYLTSINIGFAGEGERLRLSGNNAIEELRDLHYALGAILAEAARRTQ
jgi:hypothetical protein